jgi:hypothetical protein
VPTLGQAIPPNAAFQDSLTVHNGRLYLVGFQHIYEGFILSWSDRIDEQVRKKAWFEAGMTR